MKTRSKIIALLTMLACITPLMLHAKDQKTSIGAVNLNSASLEQLTMLPGVGEKKAQAIINHRTANPFKAIENLTEVKGIGPKQFEKMRAFLTLQGPTTAYWGTPGEAK